MHLAQRAYVLLVLTAIVAIAGLWSDRAGMTELWCIPAAMLLIGLAVEGWRLQRSGLGVDIETASRAFLGRTQAAAFVFRNEASRPTIVRYVAATPAGVLPAFGQPRLVEAPPRGACRDEFALVPTQLGVQDWPEIPLQVLGSLELAWWSRASRPTASLRVAPDLLMSSRARPRGQPTGERPRRVVGAGSELHQLRAYRRGDPPAWIDWKASARSAALLTREFTEDQHLDVLIALDAGRSSTVRAGYLNRFGLYANLAARLAEIVVHNDDRIGLLVFADRPIIARSPARGRPAVLALRAALEAHGPSSIESDPLAAAVKMRGMLTRRSLIVLLTDLEDVNAADPLQRTVRLLSPPHLVVAVSVAGAEIEQLAGRPARRWLDPWIALAAREHLQRAAAQRAMLQRLGVVAVSAPQEQLESAVLARYATLRRARRI
ncbi:MAG: DUF58 domain-containing protein [Sinobacteraceae bacterium]|nr:DUF58 domain-containing protein [Nevskiaceae bacterium]